MVTISLKKRICKRLTKKFTLFLFFCELIRYHTTGILVCTSCKMLHPLSPHALFQQSHAVCLEAPFKPRQLPLAEVSMALGRVAQNSPPKFTVPAGAWFFQTRQVAVWGFPLWGEGGFLDSCILYALCNMFKLSRRQRKTQKESRSLVWTWL